MTVVEKAVKSGLLLVRRSYLLFPGGGFEFTLFKYTSPSPWRDGPRTMTCTAATDGRIAVTAQTPAAERSCPRARAPV